MSSSSSKGTISKRGRSGTLGRNNPMLSELIEERKNQLFESQAQDYAEWISNFLKCEPLKPDLLAALRNGSILLQLVKRIDPTKLKEMRFPKTGEEVNLFQIRENILRFLGVCKQLGLAPDDLFAPDDLILEGNKLKVVRTLQCLRKISEDASQPKPAASSPTPSSEKLPESPAEPEPAPLGRKVSVHVRKRSIRLFDGPGPTPPGLQRRPSKNTLGIGVGFSFEKDQMAQSEEVEATQPTPPPAQPKDETQPTPPPAQPPVEEAAALPEVPEAKPDNQESGNQNDQEEAKKDEDSGEEDNEAEKSEDSDTDSEFSDAFNPEFVDILTPDIMAHLLSKDVAHFGEEDLEEDLSDTEEEDDDEEEGEEEYQERFQQTHVIQEQDELIKILKLENERLQELLEAEVISHHKNLDAAKDRITRVEEHVQELEERSEMAESKAKKAEAQNTTLKSSLEEKDRSNTLLSRLVTEKEQDLYTANIKIVQLLDKVYSLEAKLKEKDAQLAALTAPPTAEPTSTAAPEGTSDISQANEAHASEPHTAEASPSPAALPSHDSSSSLLHEVETPIDKKDLSRFVVARKGGKRRSVVLSPMDFFKDHSASSSQPASRSSSYKEPPRPAISLEEPEHQYRMWKQHPDAIPILGSLSTNDVDRQEIIYELITTETSYNRDLDLIVRRFINPLHQLIGSPKFTRQDFENIFRNLENIIKVNESFLIDLQQRNKEQWPVIKSIGDIFLKHVSSFGVYAEYCGDQQRSVTEMRRAEADSPNVRHHLEQMLAEKECRKLDVFAFLLLPMQRITKYPLLLKSLLKKTPVDDADHEFLAASLAGIEEIIKSINEYTRKRDDVARISTIEKQLDCSVIKTPINLGNSEAKGRSLIQEGLLTRLRLKNRRLAAEKAQGRKLEKLHLFFFSDMIIVTKPFRSTPESPPRYIVQVKPLKLQEAAVRNVPDSSNGIGAKNVFLLSSQATGTLVLQATNPEEKAVWINHFREKSLIVKSLLKLETVDLGHNKITIEDLTPLPKVQFDSTASTPSAEEGESATEDGFRGRSSTMPPRPKPKNMGEIEQKGSQQTLNRKDSSKEKEEKEEKQSWIWGTKKPESSLNIAVEQLSQPEFDGWLKVLSKGAFQRAVWKWRYCILKDFVLYFFMTEDAAAKATSMLVLPQYSIVAQKGVNKKNVFEVRHPTNIENVVLLSADTPEYMNIWVEALTHATLSRIAPRNFWL